MLPARLAQLHPANEGLFIGLRLSAAKQGPGWVRGGGWGQPPFLPLPLRPPSTPTATPHACSGLAVSPRSRLLVSAVPNCLQRQKGARTKEREWEPHWLVELFLDKLRTQRFVFVLPRSGLGARVIFMKMDVVFLKCQRVASCCWIARGVTNALY